MKRFTEALKWRDPWFRELSIDAKLVFFYFVDNCDAAGAWEPDQSMVNFCLKRDVDWPSVWLEFGDRVVKLPSGKLWMRKFIEFQYGKLSDSCAPHRTVIALVAKHGLTLAKGNVTLTPTLNPNATLTLPYQLPAQYPPSRVQEKGEDKEEDQDKTGSERDESWHRERRRPLPDCLNREDFRDAWMRWREYFEGMARRAMQDGTALQHLVECEKMGCERAIEAINHTISVGRFTKLFEPTKPLAFEDSKPLTDADIAAINNRREPDGLRPARDLRRERR